MKYDDEWWSKKRFDDYITRRPGTLMGDRARELDRMSAPSPSVTSRTGGPGGSSSGRQPLFPEVDEFFDNLLSQKAWRRVGMVLMIAGGFAGAGAAPSLGLATWLAALIGAAWGLLVIPLFILAVKLAIGAALIGLCLLVIYVVVTMLSG